MDLIATDDPFQSAPASAGASPGTAPAIPAAVKGLTETVDPFAGAVTKSPEQHQQVEGHAETPPAAKLT